MGLLNFLKKIGERKRLGNKIPPGSKQCAACKNIICSEEKRTKQMGLHFHRTCWKMQQKGV